jgi:hypothetical protein
MKGLHQNTGNSGACVLEDLYLDESFSSKERLSRKQPGFTTPIPPKILRGPLPPEGSFGCWHLTVDSWNRIHSGRSSSYSLQRGTIKTTCQISTIENIITGPDHGFETGKAMILLNLNSIGQGLQAAGTWFQLWCYSRIFEERTNLHLYPISL